MLKKRVADLLKLGVIPESVLQGLIDAYDPIVCITNINPMYPDWMERRIHPELNIIKCEFDVTKLQQWLHPDQINGYVGGNVVYEKIITDNLLEYSLGLAELMAIKERGIGFFRQHFSGKRLFGWRDVVMDRCGGLDAPYIWECCDKVKLDWEPLSHDFYCRCPALLISSTQS